MPMRLRIASLAVALAACLLLAACGTDADPKAFKEGYTKQKAPLKAVRQEIPKTLAKGEKGTNAELQKHLMPLVNRLKAIDKKLKALKPPREAEGKQQELTKGVDFLRGDLQRLQNALFKHDTSNARSAKTEIKSDSTRIEVAEEALDKIVSHYK